MRALRVLSVAACCVALLLGTSVLLTGSTRDTHPSWIEPAEPTPRPPAHASTSPPAPPTTGAPAPPPVPGRLTDQDLGLRAGPVPVPLRLRMPSLEVDAAVLGVGLTARDAMDAPTGSAEDPVWQQAFWYRGSAIPGANSTALIGGHISDSRGRTGVFGRIDELVPGDPVVVHDTRTGLDVRFAVAGSTSYPLDRTTDPAVLTEIYGAGPVAGDHPQPSVDGLGHLTLITCDGTFRNGTHDRRLVVKAVRIV